jgi:GNAT superfamily N-acetyltransferase
MTRAINSLLVSLVVVVLNARTLDAGFVSLPNAAVVEQRLAASGRGVPSLHLFFRTTKRDEWRGVSDSVLQDLSRAEVCFPYSIGLKYDENEGGALTSAQRTPADRKGDKILTIRLLESKDINTVTDICVNEYGDKPDLRAADVLSAEFWVNLAEFIALRPLVELSMRLKVSDNANSKDVPSDHVVLVACLRSSTKETAPNEAIVGMVEISRQPVLPQRNPSPLPLPQALKQLIFGDSLQGWITNMLVVPECRGRGYAKVLLAACDGVARRWNCRSISLHCDADPDAGRVAQQLYFKNGFQPLDGNSGLQAEYSWIAPGGTGDASFQSSVFVIDDIPLLYLQKELD